MRPFHMNSDPIDDGDWTIVSGTFTGRSISGSVWKTTSTANSVVVRDTDVATECDVMARVRFLESAATPGIVVNVQDASNYYVAFLHPGQSRHSLAKVAGGVFTLLGTYNVSPTINVFMVIRLDTQDSGGDKLIEYFVDGVSRISVTESTDVFGSGQCGYFASGGTPIVTEIDWWAFNLNIAVDSVAPLRGPVDGGQNVVISGSDIGDGSIAELGGVDATNNVATPNTSLLCVTPPHGAGAVDVKVKFGTAGSEEYSGTLSLGYIYGEIVLPTILGLRGIFMGVDISKFVTSWGRLEQIKDVLLAQATLLTSQMSIQLENFRGFANPFGPGSLMRGLNHYNGTLEIIRDGKTIYEGFVRNVPTNANDNVFTLASENILKKPAETAIVVAASNANPAQAMLSFLRLVLPEESIRAITFDQSGARATAGNATINYDFKQGENVSVMQAIQLISELSSISVFVKDNKVIAQAFIPFQGSEAGLRFEINDAIVREWGPLQYDNSSFNNVVSVGYPTEQYETQRDQRSIDVNDGLERAFTFDAEEQVVATNLTSARFFARLYLSRASRRRRTLTIAGGKELAGISIGQRFPVTQTDIALSRFPMECIEASETNDSEEVELNMAELFVE